MVRSQICEFIEMPSKKIRNSNHKLCGLLLICRRENRRTFFFVGGGPISGLISSRNDELPDSSGWLPDHDRNYNFYRSIQIKL